MASDQIGKSSRSPDRMKGVFQGGFQASLHFPSEQRQFEVRSFGGVMNEKEHITNPAYAATRRGNRLSDFLPLGARNEPGRIIFGQERGHRAKLLSLETSTGLQLFVATTETEVL